MVPPTKYRPIRLFQGDRFEHPQTVNLRRILEADQLLQLVKASVKDPKARSTLKVVPTTSSLKRKTASDILGHCGRTSDGTDNERETPQRLRGASSPSKLPL